jgi:hypothetical protein
MKRAMLQLGMLAAMAAGFVACGDDTSGPVRPDMAVKPGQDGGVDLAIGGSPIGGDCMRNSDCKTGTNPFCVKNRSVTGAVGFCAADCQTDTDCGSLATCIQFANGSQCVKSCMMASDCGTGLACYAPIGLGCYPTDAIKLDCDPTVAACTTPLISSGGCSRQALGTGTTGQCQATCDVGVGTCPPNGTNKQHCLVIDTKDDGMGGMTGDAFVGAVCQIQAPVADQKMDGVECAVVQNGMTFHFIDACVDGLECDSFKTPTHPNPDNKCHKLCYLNQSFSQDAGAPIPDGGMIASTCTTGTCTDIWGLAGSTQPVGLCE